MYLTENLIEIVKTDLNEDNYVENDYFNSRGVGFHLSLHIDKYCKGCGVGCDELFDKVLLLDYEPHLIKPSSIIQHKHLCAYSYLIPKRLALIKKDILYYGKDCLSNLFEANKKKKLKLELLKTTREFLDGLIENSIGYFANLIISQNKADLKIIKTEKCSALKNYKYVKAFNPKFVKSILKINLNHFIDILGNSH